MSNLYLDNNSVHASPVGAINKTLYVVYTNRSFGIYDIKGNRIARIGVTENLPDIKARDAAITCCDALAASDKFSW